MPEGESGLPVPAQIQKIQTASQAEVFLNRLKDEQEVSLLHVAGIVYFFQRQMGDQVLQAALEKLPHVSTTQRQHLDDNERMCRFVRHPTRDQEIEAHVFLGPETEDSAQYLKHPRIVFSFTWKEANRWQYRGAQVGIRGRTIGVNRVGRMLQGGSVREYLAQNKVRAKDLKRQLGQFLPKGSLAKKEEG